MPRDYSLRKKNLWPIAGIVEYCQRNEIRKPTRIKDGTKIFANKRLVALIGYNLAVGLVGFGVAIKTLESILD